VYPPPGGTYFTVAGGEIVGDGTDASDASAVGADRHPFGAGGAIAWTAGRWFGPADACAGAGTVEVVSSTAATKAAPVLRIFRFIAHLPGWREEPVDNPYT
jgi:hypothetical protein